jgi:FK506-binding protein 4/5
LIIYKEEGYDKLGIEEKLSVASRKKQEGNVLYNSSLFERAIKKYKLILDILTTNDKSHDEQAEQVKKLKLSSFLNIAACSLGAKKHNEVIEYSNKAKMAGHSI